MPATGYGRAIGIYFKMKYLQNKFAQIQYALQDRINEMSIHSLVESLLSSKDLLVNWLF